MSETPPSAAAPRDPVLEALYRSASSETAPAWLDDALLAAAHAEATATPRRAMDSFGRRWRVPFAIAATLVLGMSVVTLMREEQPAVLELSPPSAREERSPARAPNATPPRASKNAASVPPVPAQVETKPRTPPAERAEGASAPRVEMSRDRAAPAQAPSALDSLRQDAPLTAPSAAGNRVPAPAPAESRGRLQEAAPGEPRPFAEAVQPAPAAPVVPMRSFKPEMQNRSPAAKAAGSAVDSEAKQGRQSAATPEAWLERVRELRRGGRLDEANRLLREFRQRYPDYKLPADLERDGLP